MTTEVVYETTEAEKEDFLDKGSYMTRKMTCSLQ
jgi:hypothetical protein